MKTFIASAVFFFLVKWPFGSQEVVHPWFDYFGNFVLVLGFIYCFLEDILRRGSESNKTQK